VSLTAQVRLICGWCMKICLKRAAHISAERLISEWLISVQTDKQTEIDMETNMDVDIGDKSVYIRAFWPREISQSTSLRSIQSNNSPSRVYNSMHFRLDIFCTIDNSTFCAKLSQGRPRNS